MFDYLGQQGGETVCTILIETRSAVDNIEEICKVEGIDCLHISPFGLSTDLGSLNLGARPARTPDELPSEQARKVTQIRSSNT